MDWLALLLKLLHVGLAITLTAGLIGRWVVLGRASGEERIDRVHELTELASPFEQLVIRSSMIILPVGLATAWAQGYEWLGLTTGWMLASVVVYIAISLLVPTVFIPRGRIFEAALASAREAGSVTPELRSAFADPAVRNARWLEAAGLAVIVTLMVVKPF